MPDVQSPLLYAHPLSSPLPPSLPRLTPHADHSPTRTSPPPPPSSSIPTKVGLCVVFHPQEHLSPPILAAAASNLQGGGLLVLVLPEMEAWEELHSASAAAAIGGKQQQQQLLLLQQKQEKQQQRQAASLSLLLDRLLIRLPSCKSALFLLPSLHPLPYSPALLLPSSLPPPPQTEDGLDLISLQSSLASSPIVGPLLSLALTLDQGRALLTFLDSASEKEMGGTVVMRGGERPREDVCVGFGVGWSRRIWIFECVFNGRDSRTGPGDL